MKRLRQRMILTGDRNPSLLHRLQQRRLGAWARPVDLVGHQQLAEHRALNKAERAAAAFAFLEHLGTENVGRHQIRCALDALLIEPEHRREGLDEPGLGQARYPDQQRVATA